MTRNDNRREKFVSDVVSYILQKGAERYDLPTANLQSQINKVTEIIHKIEEVCDECYSASFQF